MNKRESKSLLKKKKQSLNIKTQPEDEEEVQKQTVESQLKEDDLQLDFLSFEEAKDFSVKAVKLTE